MKNPNKLILWLHELEVIRLNNSGLDHPPQGGIVTPTMRHSKLGQTIQIHIMKAYAQLGLEDIDKALRLVHFKQKQDDFLGYWLPNADREIGRQTTPAATLSNVLIIPYNKISLRTNGKRLTYWCWPVGFRQDARAGASHCIPVAGKTREPVAEYWPWLTIATRRSKSDAGSQTWLTMMPGA